MKFSVSPFYNWVTLESFGWRLTFMKGKGSKKLFEFWKSPLNDKYTIGTKFCYIILKGDL